MLARKKSVVGDFGVNMGLVEVGGKLILTPNHMCKGTSYLHPPHRGPEWLCSRTEDSLLQ